VCSSDLPNLSPKLLKKILIESSLKNYKNKKVIKPGTKDELIEFEELGKNGGIINLYEAIKLAEKL
jgi:hypothetical protein